jgi:acetyl esterase/lipase
MLKSIERKVALVSFILVMGLIFSCAEPEEAPLNLDPAVAVEILDDDYGNHPRQVMDVYLPANRSRTSTKLFLWIHGGAWTDGDKSEFSRFKPWLEAEFEDYAFVSMNYRLFNLTTGSNRFPNQEEDVKDAINYIQSRMSAWDVSNEIVIAGASAGGHLALLHAYKNNSNNLVKAAVAFFPPTDFPTFHGHTFITTALIEALIGGTPSSNPQGYAAPSPTSHINSNSVPTAFFHGSADNVVPIQQSRLLEEKLNSNRVPFTKRYVEGGQHGFPESVYREMIAQTADFLAIQEP